MSEGVQLAKKRLYLHDSYLTEFEAAVMERAWLDGAPAVVLDQTAFYPEGGGQPADRGTLNGVPVVDVRMIDGHVWHVLAGELEAKRVHGVVDWARRWDHMQQHTGQHILSQAFIAVAGVETVAFHLSEEASTIDLNRTGLNEATLSAVEQTANRVVWENRLVRARFVTSEELSALPLRRPPQMHEHVRIVEIEGFDWSACGGTHVRATGEVGLIKITRIERRGKETRVTFLCGGRALADYARKHALVQRLVNRLTCAEHEIERAVERLEAEGQMARKALRAAEETLVGYEAASLLREALSVGGIQVIARVYSDRSPEWVRSVAQTLREQPGMVALLACRGERPQLIFTRSPDVPVDVNALLRIACQVSGGRGGGRADWAQGGGGAPEQLEAALTAAVEALRGEKAFRQD
ncbi:MAG: DHHA1 domain-containing protein [Anaerolineae bacterium]|nr:DHHA1 domain-containing protein [Anaerolineae bacterium]